MLRWFPRKRHWPIALDLGADSIKMLQLTQSGKGLAVRACAQWRFPESIRRDRRLQRQEGVRAVRQMLRSNRFRGRRVVTALCCEEMGIKNIRLPRMPKGELRQAIEWQARERFTFEVKPDRLAFLNAGHVRQGKETQNEVILLAAPEEAVEERLEMLDAMGLRPENIEAEPVALFRSVGRFLRRKADEDMASVLVDVGFRATRVVVGRGRRIVFIKNIDVGGRTLTEVVARQLNVSFEDAAELRRSAGGPPGKDGDGEKPQAAGDRSSLGWTIHDALRGEVESLVREISLCLRYCSVTFRGLRPEQVTVTGGEAYDPTLIKLLTDGLGVACAPARPLRGVDVSDCDFCVDRRGMLSEWALCAGLSFLGAELEAETGKASHGTSQLPA